MQLSETIRLYPTKYQKELLWNAMNTYIATVNQLVQDGVCGVSLAKVTTASVVVDLPSALKNQCIRDAKSIVNKHRRNCHKAVLQNRKLAKQHKLTHKKANRLPIVKKPCCYVNNQNFKIKDNMLQIPLMIDGKSKRISIAVKLSQRQKNLFSDAQFGTLRIVKKQRFLVAQIVYEVEEPSFQSEGEVMGIDLGIKCPAVSYCSDGSVKFYGNGRKNKYLRRHYQSLRKKLQKNKKIKALDKINQKEQRIMCDTDHKLSHAMIRHAVSHQVKIIKMECLQNIRSTTRTSRKNNHSLHNWSFYRLAKFIEYKARLVGIKVVYVNPAYTSQKCPICGKKHHAKDRKYECECGFCTHRDLLGARNICNSTEYVGNRHIA